MRFEFGKRAVRTSFNVIQLLWEGPLAETDVIQHDTDNYDYGVYAIYGTHAVSGPDSLLYIGQAGSNPFGKRVPAHVKAWTKYEADEPTVFLGRISGVQTGSLDDLTWGALIDAAERILIFECAPPYNSKGLKDIALQPSAPSGGLGTMDFEVQVPDVTAVADPAGPHVLVVNLGRRHRLPLYCSNYFSTLKGVEPDSYYRRTDTVIKA